MARFDFLRRLFAATPFADGAERRRYEAQRERLRDRAAVTGARGRMGWIGTMHNPLDRDIEQRRRSERERRQ